ncbi:uncharacterized protein ABDE67_016943 [Symphorus nematophorus]
MVELKWIHISSFLMVVFQFTVTEQKDADVVTLSCSVSTYGRCRHTVKWLYVGNVDEHNQEVKISQPGCSASVTFPTSHYIYDSSSNLLKCEVTDGRSGKVQLFPFRLQRSGEKPGEESTTTTTEATTTDDASKGVTTKPTTTESTTIKLTGTTNDALTKLKDLWWVFLIVAAVVVVALLIIVVKVIRWKRAKGNKTQMNDKTGLTSDPTVDQWASETSKDTPDPEDGVSYAVISYTKKTNGEARSKNDDGDAVTYTTVKASSADPSNLYATIN